MKRGLILALGLLAAAVLVFVLRDFIRDSIVIPLAYNIWLLRLKLESLPHIIPWALLIVVLLLFARRTLSTQRSAQRRRPPPLLLRRRGRVEVWSNWLRMTARGDYFQWNLAQQLTHLTIETLAHLENISTESMRRRVLEGRIDMPPDVQTYLSAGLRYRQPSRFTSWIDRWLGRARTSPFDLDPEKLVAFIEAQMGEELDYPNR